MSRNLTMHHKGYQRRQCDQCCERRSCFKARTYIRGILKTLWICRNCY